MHLDDRSEDDDHAYADDADDADVACAPDILSVDVNDNMQATVAAEL